MMTEEQFKQQTGCMLTGEFVKLQTSADYDYAETGPERLRAGVKRVLADLNLPGEMSLEEGLFTLMNRLMTEPGYRVDLAALFQSRFTCYDTFVCDLLLPHTFNPDETMPRYDARDISPLAQEYKF